jgi:hypothetical protein
MTRYCKEVLLESKEYKSVRFVVLEADTPEICDKELIAWIKKYPKLIEMESNKDILFKTLNWKI